MLCVRIRASSRWSAGSIIRNNHGAAERLDFSRRRSRSRRPWRTAGESDVTPQNGTKVEGTLVRLDDFYVVVLLADGLQHVLVAVGDTLYAFAMY